MHAPLECAYEVYDERTILLHLLRLLHDQSIPHAIPLMTRRLGAVNWVDGLGGGRGFALSSPRRSSKQTTPHASLGRPNILLAKSRYRPKTHVQREE
jgi:hypothetical protein